MYTANKIKPTRQIINQTLTLVDSLELPDWPSIISALFWPYSYSIMTLNSGHQAWRVYN